MSNFWFLEGLRKGKKTEKFPAEPPEGAPLRPSRMTGNGDIVCPTGAISNSNWYAGKCIFCRKCEPLYKPSGDQSMYTINNKEKLFRKSFYLYKLDSGTCGACNIELGTIFDPQYDANRLNIFMTNSPRHADAIIIMGVFTEGMREPLERAYEAMPDPKLVIALGVCAISGGMIGKPSLDRGKYSVEIAGCPPSPHTILEALMKTRGD